MPNPRMCKLKTLETIQADTIEEGNCWLWQGGMGGPGQKTPIMQFRGKVRPAYVATWMLKTGAESVPDGLSIWRGCRSMRCINPGCLKTGTGEQMRAWLTRHGAYKLTPGRKAAVTARARANPNTKLKGGIAQAREIRTSNLTEKELSAQHGISVSRVNRIRNNRAWAETAIPQASIFSMGAA